jgi:tRNA U34 2-thiouridine synthase MnmA/TrmU
VVSGAGRSAQVTFDAPVRAATKGQVAVLYDDAERVLGGGRIARVQTAERPVVRGFESA